MPLGGDRKTAGPGSTLVPFFFHNPAHEAIE